MDLNSEIKYSYLILSYFGHRHFNCYMLLHFNIMLLHFNVHNKSDIEKLRVTCIVKTDDTCIDIAKINADKLILETYTSSR